jgi:hypothetical protein
VTSEQQLAQRMMSFKRDPLRFAKFAYPWGQPGDLADSQPHQWQLETLAKIRDHLNSYKRFTPLQISVASGHGIGKSALIAWVMDWAMSTCIDCRVTVTAGTGKQIETKTWPEVTKWFKLGINAHWWEVKAESITAKDKEHERTWRADVNTWSKNNPGAFAGLHNSGKRIVIIYDESSTIDDVVWEVTSGALTDTNTEIIWIAFGNPTETTGRFRECFGKYRHRWDTQQIDSRTVPGTNKELFDEWVADYGEDSDFVRVRVRGVFPRGGTKQFIPNDLVAAARNRVCEARGWKILSVDVAREGDDRTVIGLRQGRVLRILDKLRGLSTVECARKIMERMREHNPRTTIIDGDGIGGGVLDVIRDEMPRHDVPKSEWPDTVMARWWLKNPNWTLQEFHGGQPANDGFMYFNLRAEVWGRMRGWLETADIPDEVEVETDLTGLQYGHSGKNQIQLERKQDMKKRGLASPDIGDMLAMSFHAQPLGMSEEETLSERLAAIDDPMWRELQRIKATLDKDKAYIEDNRPEWMREG